MTQEIPKKEWKEFFDELSRHRQEWQTRVEIMKDDTGTQVLSSGLPLMGFTAENANGREFIEIALGNETGKHQMHVVENPSVVSLLSEEDKMQSIVMIKDANEMTTLVYIEPMPIAVSYTKVQLFSELG